jgi:predicted ATP-dependent endonuclease of OLD family
MRYKSFHFENFKGIKDMSLPLTEGVTTLIGLNESGKTTILEAIFCFSYGAEDLEVINPGMASLRDKEKWIPISRRANFNDNITISATVELDKKDKDALRRKFQKEFGLYVTTISDEVTITEQHKYENSRYTETSRFWTLEIWGTKGQQRNPRSYARSSCVEWKAAVNYIKEMLPRIWYFPNFLFELPERFTLTPPAGTDEEQKDKNQFYVTTFENIVDQLGYGATLQTHVVERLRSDERADQRSLGAVLLDMSRSITSTIFEGWNRIFARAPTAQEVELNAEVEANGGATLELRIKGPDGYYDLSERSLGFRWFFMFFLMTSFTGDAKAASKPLFLLDEPASNLHSSAQAELLQSFEKLLDRCSLVYTTHSHHLINIRWLDSAYVVKNEALGAKLDMSDYMSSRIAIQTSVIATKYRRFVSEHPDQTSYFQPVLDLLDYRPSVVEPVPNVVLVEGKSDFYLLRYVTEILGVKPNLHFVPGTGAGSLDTVIRIYLGWAKSFVILLDGDAEGRKQRERYERTFERMVDRRCVLLPDMCGDASVKEVESLLSPVDRAALLDSVYAFGVQRPTVKKALREAVIELYARGDAVQLEEESARRLGCLLTALSDRLAEQ